MTDDIQEEEVRLRRRLLFRLLRRFDFDNPDIHRREMISEPAAATVDGFMMPELMIPTLRPAP